MNRKKILLVDDDYEDAEFFKWAFLGNEENFKLQFVDSGDAAILHLEQMVSPPDLILLDGGMPKMSGWELLKCLKFDSRFAHIPVVMIATSSKSSRISEAYALGAMAYIVKPSDFNDLKNIMNQLCCGIKSDLKEALNDISLNSPGSIFNFT